LNSQRKLVFTIDTFPTSSQEGERTMAREERKGRGTRRKTLCRLKLMMQEGLGTRGKTNSFKEKSSPFRRTCPYLGSEPRQKKRRKIRIL